MRTSKAREAKCLRHSGFMYSFVIRHSDFVIFPSMKPARFQTIEEIFRAALDQEPDQVSAFLDTACGGDEVLRREVEALLASRERAGSFIETSAVGLATKIIQNRQADSLVGRTIGHYKISERSAPAGWVKSIWPPTLQPAARPRSNSCPCVLPVMPSA